MPLTGPAPHAARSLRDGTERAAPPPSCAVISTLGPSYESIGLSAGWRKLGRNRIGMPIICRGVQHSHLSLADTSSKEAFWCCRCRNRADASNHLRLVRAEIFLHPADSATALGPSVPGRFATSPSRITTTHNSARIANSNVTHGRLGGVTKPKAKNRQPGIPYPSLRELSGPATELL